MNKLISIPVLTCIFLFSSCHQDENKDFPTQYKDEVENLLNNSKFDSSRSYLLIDESFNIEADSNNFVTDYISSKGITKNNMININMKVKSFSWNKIYKDSIITEEKLNTLDNNSKNGDTTNPFNINFKPGFFVKVKRYSMVYFNNTFDKAIIQIVYNNQYSYTSTIFYFEKDKQLLWDLQDKKSF